MAFRTKKEKNAYRLGVIAGTRKCTRAKKRYARRGYHK